MQGGEEEGKGASSLPPLPERPSCSRAEEEEESRYSNGGIGGRRQELALKCTEQSGIFKVFCILNRGQLHEEYMGNVNVHSSFNYNKQALKVGWKEEHWLSRKEEEEEEDGNRS